MNKITTPWRTTLIASMLIFGLITSVSSKCATGEIASQLTLSDTEVNYINAEDLEISSTNNSVPLICGEGLEVTYCYENFDETIFTYESPDGEPVALFFQKGLIQWCCDYIFIYDGLDNSGELLFSGNNNGDLAGVSVTANSGAVFIELETNGTASCTSGSTSAGEWAWIVGCGEFDILGCTDPEALNFAPDATVDNGSCIIPAENDEPCGAIALECNGPSIAGNFDAASISYIFPIEGCGSAFPGKGDLWFQFEANGTSMYFISAVNSASMVAVALYSGDDCGNLTEVEGCVSLPENVSGIFDAGTYYFIVRPWSGSAFNNSYDVNLICADGPPENDELCGAIELVCNAEAINGSFFGSTTSMDDNCSDTGTGDVWFSFIADGETDYGVFETSYDNTSIGLYTADECGDELTQVIPCHEIPESVNGIFDEGKYYVRLSTFSSKNIFYTIQLNCATVPENNLPCDAIEINCDSENISGMNLGATPNEGCSTSSGGGGIWYVFNSEIDGALRLNMCQDDTPLTYVSIDISVFTGTCEELTCYAYDFGMYECWYKADLAFDVSNGTTYYILVNGHNQVDVGNFDMEISCSENPDCPGVGGFGDSCNDGNPATTNDVVTENCECEGTPQGQSCEVSFEIISLPFQDNDNTNNFGDEYETTDLPPLAPDAINNGFSTSYLGGDEVVYSYTPIEDQTINVTLSNHGEWTGLFVIEGCPFESTVGSHTASDFFGREIEDLAVSAGVTYYVVISTWPAPQSTAYQLNISVSEKDCPELEADFGDPCDDGDVDTINDQIILDCVCGGVLSSAVQCGEYTSEPNANFGGPGYFSTLWDDIEVSGADGTLADLNVVLVIDNEEVITLAVRLCSPSGTEVDLVVNECINGDNINVLLDDDSPALSCEAGSIPVLFGTFAPEGSLANFNGEDFNGTWTLKIYDNDTGIHSGKLISWCLLPTLEIPSGSPCDNATAIDATPVASESLLDVSMAETLPSGIVQCVNPSFAQPDRWFSFESVTTNMYVRASGQNDFDAAVEVFESCDGTAIACQNNTSAGQAEIVTIMDTEVGQTYYFRVYNAGDNASVEQDFDVSVIHIPFTQLSEEDCGILNYSLNDTLTTDLPVNQFQLTNWYWQFTELEEPFNTYDILSPNGAEVDFPLELFAEAEIGRTYEVRTRARLYKDFQWGDYGDACTIGFISVPGDVCLNAIEITPGPGFTDNSVFNDQGNATASGVPQCNGDAPSVDTWFSFEAITTTMAVRVKGVGDYDIVLEVWNGCGGNRLKCKNEDIEARKETVVLTNSIVGETYYFRIYDTGGNDLTSVSQWVSVAHLPITKLEEADCSSNVYSTSDIITAAIPEFEFSITEWTYEFTELEAPFNVYEVVSPNGGNPNFLLNQFTQIETGRSYSVRVKPSVAPNKFPSDYGEACEIIIAEGSGIAILNGSNSISDTSVEMKLFPNPSNGDEVTLVFGNLPREEAQIIVRVYDLVGKQVHSEQYSGRNETSTFNLDIQSLSEGVYLVGAEINGELITRKLFIE